MLTSQDVSLQAISLARERDLGVIGEKSLKTSVQCVVGIIKRQQILNMVKKKIETKYDIILFLF